MFFSKASHKTLRVLTSLFLVTTLATAGAWVYGYRFVKKLTLVPITEPELPAKMRPLSGPPSPLQVKYQLDLPGRGEIFPALVDAKATDYWPLAVLTIAN